MRKYILKACNKLLDMDTAADLRKEKFTISDYETAWNTAVELSKTGKSETFNSAIASYFERNGCKVELKGVNYQIS